MAIGGKELDLSKGVWYVVCATHLMAELAGGDDPEARHQAARALARSHEASERDIRVLPVRGDFMPVVMKMLGGSLRLGRLEWD